MAKFTFRLAALLGNAQLQLINAVLRWPTPIASTMCCVKQFEGLGRELDTLREFRLNERPPGDPGYRQVWLMPSATNGRREPSSGTLPSSGRRWRPRSNAAARHWSRPIVKSACWKSSVSGRSSSIAAKKISARSSGWMK